MVSWGNEDRPETNYLPEKENKICFRMLDEYLRKEITTPKHRKREEACPSLECTIKSALTMVQSLRTWDINFQCIAIHFVNIHVKAQ